MSNGLAKRKRKIARAHACSASFPLYLIGLAPRESVLAPVVLEVLLGLAVERLAVVELVNCARGARIGDDGGSAKDACARTLQAV